MEQHENLRRTPVYEEHVRLGGKIVPFAGYEMPVQFDGVIAEHLCVREKAGIFDVSHMGEVTVKGEEALDFVNYLITNDASKLADNQVLYTPMLYENGGIVDDLLVYRNSQADFLLVINASNIEKDFSWMQSIKSKKGFKVELTNISYDTAEFAVQGPNSEKLLNKAFSHDFNPLQYFHFTRFNYHGKDLLISRTGYTGEDGFEIYLKNEHAVEIYKKLFEFSEEFGLKPIGLGARDTLRFEARLMLYGNDIDQDTNPLEAGLKWTVKMDKSDFCGKDSLEKIESAGLNRRLVGFEMVDKGIPRHGYKIITNGTETGIVTSGTYAPYLKKNLGLGYVPSEHKQKGTEIFIDIRGKQLKAIIVSTPFYKRQK